MYQLATDGPVDKLQLFIATCTSMVPSTENMKLVRSATSLVRGVLAGGDIASLREFVHAAEGSCPDVDDVVAAAGQAVIEEFEGQPRARLHDVVRRVAQIERDAFAGLSGAAGASLQPAFAG